MPQSPLFIAAIFSLLVSSNLVTAAEQPQLTETLALPAPLTPPVSATPRINGPAVFGVRPGSPFLYSIPASGERPMTFSADALPPGLQIDSTTGHISGVLKVKGEFSTTLRAVNKLGSAQKKFRIVVGDRIALTPPMGWNSWNCWGGSVDQEKMLASAKAMVASGLIEHGWSYINIDDGWQGERSGSFNGLQPNEKFPSLKELCDTIHGFGLKAGIYSTPWVMSYAGHLGGSAENPQGTKQTWEKVPVNQKKLPKAIGKFSFAKNDAQQWAAWGIDYLKYDWNPVEAPETHEMADALRASGRDIVLSLSNNGGHGGLFDRIADIAPLAQSWRTTDDVTDTWGSVAGIGFSQEKWAPFQKSGAYNDPDMLVVGHVGWGKPHPSRLTPDQQYSHISLWCLLGAPLMIGCDLTKLDAFTLGLLTNDEVLEIDQDELCKQAVRIGSEGSVEFYAKSLADGSYALGLFNRSEQPVSAGFKNLSAMGFKEKYKARDLWRQKDIPDFSKDTTVTIQPCGVVLLRLTKSP